MPDAFFRTLAHPAHAIAATSRRTEKTETAAACFAALDDADLRRAARYLAGRARAENGSGWRRGERTARRHPPFRRPAASPRPPAPFGPAHPTPGR